MSGKECGDLGSQDTWLDKAETCLRMGLKLMLEKRLNQAPKFRFAGEQVRLLI